MEFLVRIGVSVVGKAAEYIVEPVGRQIGYLFYYKSNVDNLETKVQELKDARERIEHSTDAARRNGEEIEGDVQNWLSKADTICGEVEKLLPKDEGQANYTWCSGRSFSAFIMRYKLSKKAKKMTQVVNEVRDAGKFDKVSFRRPLPNSIKIKGYEIFETRMPTLLRIMEALRDPSIGTIGVWGMGGVGKTMLVKEVARQTKSEDLFSQVVTTTVSQTPDYRKIQEEVAENLGLKLEENTVSVRARRLEARLREEKKILVVLDDVWNKLELEEVGIIFADDQRGCKILLTSRSKEVLRNDMDVDRSFELGVLSDSEATSLFSQIVGGVVKEHDFLSLGIQIVKECAGLPLAISTVANALKNKASPIWKDALQALKASNPTTIKGMHERVYSSIKLSYNFVGSEQAKSLFLLCSLYEEDADIDIDELVKYGTGLNLFDQDIIKLDDARNRVLNLVENLRASSLLLDGKRFGFVKMHDVVRDVAVSIALNEKEMCSIRNVGELEVIQKKNKLKNLTAISLCCDDLLNNGRFLCPKLLFLSIKGSRRFPESKCSSEFFEAMKELQVLSLDYINLNPPPPSLCFLKNLQTLVLRECRLRDITWIGELTNLEILDLSGSTFGVVPKQLGNLTRLRSLNLDGYQTYKYTLIEPGVISNLVQLEELIMGGQSFTDRAVEEMNSERSNASLVELKNLEHLTTLHLIASPFRLVENLFTDKLERYALHIGSYLRCSCKYVKRYSRFLDIYMADFKSNIEHSGLKFLLKKAEEVHVRHQLGTLNNVIPELDEDGFSQLKILRVELSFTVRYIINLVEKPHPCNAFKSLEELHLSSMTNLEKISNCKLGVESFIKLRVVVINGCNALKNLFHFSIARQLENIEVRWCKVMETIFTDEREVDTHNVEIEVIENIEFPLLRSLRLEDLPELTQFCGEAKRTGRTFPQRTEEQLNVTSELPFFHPKPLGKGSTSFRNLKELFVFGACGTSKYLFSASVAVNLVQLNRLEIKECFMMEEMISADQTIDRLMLFPRLSYLLLEKLPKLTRFCTSSVAFPHLKTLRLESLDILELICHNHEQLVADFSSCEFEGISGETCFQSLTELSAARCGSLKYLFSSSLAANLVQLSRLVVEECNMLEGIISTDYKTGDGMLLPQVVNLKTLHLSSLNALDMICNNQEPVAASSFCGLEYLFLDHCENLKKFSFNILRSLQSLRRLTIEACERMEEVFEIVQGSNVNEKCEVVACQLSTLHLYDLPNLKHVWSKEPNGALTFQRLENILVRECASLKSLFPTYVAKDLLQLKFLELSDCNGIEEVVGKEEGGEETISPKFVFPHLTTLYLRSLRKLACFYPGLHSSEWSSLKSLELTGCWKITVLASELLSFQRKVHETAHEDTPIQPSLFLMDKVIFPKMEKLTLGPSLDLSRIQNECLQRSTKLYAETFPSLKPWNLTWKMPRIC